MIVIHIGMHVLMYPVKDPAERGLVFSKYKFKKLGDPKLIKLVHNYWYFVVCIASNGVTL